MALDAKTLTGPHKNRQMLVPLISAVSLPVSQPHQEMDAVHTLYDSETFSVTHMLANPDSDVLDAARTAQDNAGQYPQGIPMLARHGFEIVDKRSGKEVYLDGSWAEMFQLHIMAWQQNTPTQEEVEDTLDSYAGLAQNPVVMH